MVYAVKLFVDNLTNVDFSYLHSTRGLLGESWLVQLELDGSLNEQGMICDFGIVKKAVKDWFDAEVDHCLVVPAGMERLQVERAGGYTRVDWQYEDGAPFHCYSPDEAITLVALDEVTEDTLAAWCHQKILELFPAEYVQGLSIRFVPEQIDGAFYHYSHGLQQHEGNCQRIAHGHRSKIEIFLDDVRNTALEQHWADVLEDIYIGTRSHLVEAAEQHHYRYQAPQGDFELKLPARVCHLMDTETTVELIACHLADQISAEYSDAVVRVRAFEGVGKGAIAERRPG